MLSSDSMNDFNHMLIYYSLSIVNYYAIESFIYIKCVVQVLKCILAHYLEERYWHSLEVDFIIHICYIKLSQFVYIAF